MKRTGVPNDPWSWHPHAMVPPYLPMSPVTGVRGWLAQQSPEHYLAPWLPQGREEVTYQRSQWQSPQPPKLQTFWSTTACDSKACSWVTEWMLVTGGEMVPFVSESQTQELEVTQRSPLHVPHNSGIPSPRLFWTLSGASKTQSVSVLLPQPSSSSKNSVQ